MRDEDDNDNRGARMFPQYWKAITTEDGKVLCVEADPPFTQGSVLLNARLSRHYSTYDFDTVFVGKDTSTGMRKYLATNLRLRVVDKPEPSAPPPGLGLVERVLGWVMPGKTYKRVIAETIADFKQEHAEARSSDQPWRARWFVVLGYLAIVRALAAQLLSIVELIRKLSS